MAENSKYMSENSKCFFFIKDIQVEWKYLDKWLNCNIYLQN